MALSASAGVRRRSELAPAAEDAAEGAVEGEVEGEVEVGVAFAGAVQRS
ncbi:hypothetical protein ACFSEO_13865 [Agromyces cerinus subsp. nitratus]